jgi:uncharacterized protein with HEPN domain
LRHDAVIKNLTVIGEAAGRVPASVVDASPQIPWPRMRAMRNVVVHEYFGIDDDLLWGTVTDDLKPLVPLLATLLSEQHAARARRPRAPYSGKFWLVDVPPQRLTLGGRRA